MCDIRRIDKSIQKFGDRFLDKIFTKNERAYCEGKSGRASYYAKRFAAKEAVAKALAGKSTGSLSWRDVEVFNQPSGRPVIKLHKGAKERLDTALPKDLGASIHISLTDDYPYALAFVVIETHMLPNRNDP